MNASQDTIFGGSFLVAPLGSQPQFIPEELSDDAKAVGQAAREFVEGEIIPNDAAIDKLDLELSRELLGKAGELGLLSLEIPEAFDLTPEEAQQFMDELWRVGVRPTAGAGSVGQLAATERHLEDMRTLVFKSNT